MSRLYRAALPEDYVHNPETGLWELSFDQRPVAGTRSSCPEEGAAQYNAAREKFKSAVSAVRQRPEPVFSFTAMPPLRKSSVGGLGTLGRSVACGSPESTIP